MGVAFNDYIYKLRIKRGYTSPRKFAKEIGISPFRYGMYERGYLQPNAKDKKIIEDLTGESLDPYLEGENSYPKDIKPKKNPAFHGLSKLFKNRVARIITYVLTFVGLSCIPASIVLDQRNDSSKRNFYTAEYMEMYQKVKEEGTFTIDLIGYFDKREISLVDSGNYYVTVKAPVSPYGMKEIYFENTIRDEYVRYDIRYKDVNDLTFVLNDNGTGEYWSYYTKRLGNDTFANGTFGASNYSNKWSPEASRAFINNDFKKIIYQSDALFQRLFDEKFDRPNINFYNDIIKVKQSGDSVQNNLSVAFSITAFLGIPIGILGLAFILLWWLYMYPERLLTLKTNELSVSDNQGEVRKKHLPLPTNKTFPFFVGEEAIRIIGVILLFFGSIRTVLALVEQLGLISLINRAFDSSTLLNVFVNIFFLGIFMNYITEMDSLNDEQRLFRNLVVYGFLFLTIGTIQSVAVNQLDYMGNGIIYTLEKFLPNNFFGIIFLFFLTAVFLYYLPQRFVGKKRLTLMWRWFSIIPLLAVISLYFLIQFVPTLFGYNTTKYLAYFFGAERLPFALLTFIYLFGTYFLRRYYYHKYGQKRARIFFRGERYNFIKNFILVMGAFGIGVLEIVMFFLLPNNAFGLGQSIYILFIIPLFMFFKPRNGDRNVGASIVASSLYVMAIIIYYSLTIALVVLYGFSA